MSIPFPRPIVFMIGTVSKLPCVKKSQKCTFYIDMHILQEGNGLSEFLSTLVYLKPFFKSEICPNIQHYMLLVVIFRKPTTFR